LRAMDTLTTETEYQAFAVDTADPPALLMWGREGCPFCAASKPIVEKFAQRFPKLRVGYVDTDLQERLAKQRRISSVPTFTVMWDGRQRGRLVGKPTLAELVEFVDGALAR
jgi:thioredoxin 2